jgi:AraC family transcriptional regulator
MTNGLGARPTVSRETLAARDVIPSRQCLSSRDEGWTSLLLDVHTGVSSHEPYTARSTADFRVGVTLSGQFSCEAYAGGRWRHDVHDPGSIMLHHTSDLTRYRFPKPRDEGYRLGLIYLPVGLIEGAHDLLRQAGSPSGVPRLHSVTTRDPAISEVARALHHALVCGQGDLYAETAGAWLSMHLLTRHGPHTGRQARSPGMMTDARLARVLDYMAAHFAEPLTLEQLAAEACVSKYHFTRLFRTKLGQTPLRRLASIRLEAARRMLLDTELPIAAVARACGYPVPSHFSAAYGDHFGVSPSAERRGRREPTC